MLGEGAKGASAKKVQEEEGGAVPVAEEEDEGEREFGKVKSYNDEKGFAFIVSGRSLSLSLQLRQCTSAYILRLTLLNHDALDCTTECADVVNTGPVRGWRRLVRA